MPVLKKRFSERNQPLMGVLGALVVAALVVGSLSASKIGDTLTKADYRAQFAEAGGLREGDDVRVSGLSVGQVRSIAIEGHVVEVGFTIDDDVNLGSETSASIKSATVLGRKFIEVIPGGEGAMESGEAIPLARTQTPFDVQARLEGLGDEVAPLNKEQLANAIDTVTATLEQTPEEVRAALEGVRRASEVVNKRDGALLGLLESASQVSGLLAARSGEVTTLVRDANALLTELTVRREALRAVLVNVDALFEQLKGLAVDNDAQIGPALRELGQVSELLKRNRGNVSAAIEGLRNYTGSLGEAVNGGPWFYGYIANLVPSNMAQQTVASILDQIPDAGGQTP